MAGATVTGTNLNDRLAGGKDAVLKGGAGSDTYTYNTGNGQTHIVDWRNGGDVNTLRFGAGITSGQIKLRLGSLMLDLGNGDAVHIDNLDPNDVLGSSSIRRFEFEDEEHMRWRNRAGIISKTAAANDETTTKWRMAA